MAIATVLSILATEIGLPLAKKVMDKISSSRDGQNKLVKVSESIQAGASAVDALRGAFGGVFDNALSAATGTGAHGWTYEAGRSEYIVIQVSDAGGKARIKILRDELNINLDRIRKIPCQNGEEIGNYFRGVFAVWMERYEDLIGVNKDSKNTFEVITKLLNGDERSYRDVLLVLFRGGLGITSILMFFYAGMLLTNTGLGVVAWAKGALFGLPMLKVALLVIPATLFLILSGIKYPPKRTRTSCIALANGLLKKHTRRSRQTK